MMHEVTLRCRVRDCKAKVLVALDDAHVETFHEAMDLGRAGEWHLYWAVVAENDVRCHAHEGLAVNDHDWIVPA